MVAPPPLQMNNAFSLEFTLFSTASPLTQKDRELYNRLVVNGDLHHVVSKTVAKLNEAFASVPPAGPPHNEVNHPGIAAGNMCPMCNPYRYVKEVVPVISSADGTKVLRLEYSSMKDTSNETSLKFWQKSIAVGGGAYFTLQELKTIATTLQKYIEIEIERPLASQPIISISVDKLNL